MKFLLGGGGGGELAGEEPPLQGKRGNISSHFMLQKNCDKNRLNGPPGLSATFTMLYPVSSCKFSKFVHLCPFKQNLYIEIF